MGMISKKGLGMHMGGVSTAKLQKEAHNQVTNDDPFGDGYDPFASNDSTSSNSFETMLKDTFGTDFDGLNKNMKPSDEEPIKKLKFGNGVFLERLGSCWARLRLYVRSEKNGRFPSDHYPVTAELKFR